MMVRTIDKIAHGQNGHGLATGEAGLEPYSYGKNDGVAKITINRPELDNAMTTQTFREIGEAFRDVEADQTIGVVVLTGARGDRTRRFVVEKNAGNPHLLFGMTPSQVVNAVLKGGDINVRSYTPPAKSRANSFWAVGVSAMCPRWSAC